MNDFEDFMRTRKTYIYEGWYADGNTLGMPRHTIPGHRIEIFDGDGDSLGYGMGKTIELAAKQAMQDALDHEKDRDEEASSFKENSP